MSEQNKVNLSEMHFDSGTPEEWRAFIEQELKGVPYEKVQTLTSEGICIEPFYMQDVEKEIPFLQHSSWYSFIRNLNSKALQIRQSLIPSDVSELMNASDLQPFHAGFIGFSISDLAHAVQNLPIAAVDIKDAWSEVLSASVCGLNLPGTTCWQREEVPIHTQWPLGFRPYGFRGDIYHYRGANAVQVIAYMLQDMISWIESAIHAGLSVREALERMHFRFALGPDLFLSVAQIRAFRALYYRIVLSYGLTEVSEPCILTESSLRYHAEADRHNNLLRSGTAGMAAMTTGVYSFEAWPFSSHEKRNFALRMSRNMLNLMRGESYLEKSQDPFGGSWFIESYTYSLYQKSLDKLQQLSALGDANDAWVQARRQQEVEESGSAQAVALDTGKLSLLGVNMFPNIREAKALDFQIPGAPASIIRLAAPYEQLMEMGRHLQGYMLHMVSDVSACQARVDFIQQFMSSCGIREAEGASPLIVVCGIDADYVKSETLDWIRQYSASSQVVLAGSPIDSKEALLDAGIRRMITMHSSRIEAASFFHSVLSKQKA